MATWQTKTPEEIIADVKRMVKAIGEERPTYFRVPLSVLERLVMSREAVRRDNELERVRAALLRSWPRLELQVRAALAVERRVWHLVATGVESPLRGLLEYPEEAASGSK